ncbi:sugar phosphate isomerase/epimerase family protein [Alicyclobacillus dauci]|uniref:Sugar phosphate isomerase/epimerase n=1 Tax=Alicyclobacillus dauci TaxID=1475485 RepID=A0ABY6Z032_9BACL|nr:sugar phosphate isomerase/epimerase family protein [Alicyclobacillus dauci]WAH35576.1 sugar phosphate isomerase/epimerase [Alicyclobacillus dauci]
MKAGLNLWCFPEAWSFEEICRLAAQEGIDRIEVNLAEDGLFPLDGGTSLWSTRLQVAREFGLQVPSVATGLLWQYSLTSPDVSARRKAADVVRHMFELAKLAGAETVLVVPGAVTADVGYAEAYKRAQDELASLAEEAGQLGISIGIENVWNRFLLSPLELKRFIDEIGHPSVGVYLDVGNVLPNGFPEDWVNVLGNQLLKVHVKDFRLDIGNISGFVPIFHGDVNWTSVLNSLDHVGYNGDLIAEVPPGRNFPSENVLVTIRSLSVLCRRYDELRYQRR